MLARYIGIYEPDGFVVNGIYDLHEKIYHDDGIDNRGVRKHCIILFDTNETRYKVYKDIKSILKDWVIME